jgi:hypothetical protein
MPDLDADEASRLPRELVYTPGESRETAVARAEWFSGQDRAIKARAAAETKRLATLERDVKALAAALVKVATAVEKAQKDAATTRQALIQAMPGLSQKLASVVKKESATAARRVGVELESEYALCVARGGPKVDTARLDKIEQRLTALQKQVSALALKHA